jgi:hypothetical protein
MNGHPTPIRTHGSRSGQDTPNRGRVPLVTAEDQPIPSLAPDRPSG